MRIDALRAGMTYLIAILVLVGGFYALVLFPYQLDDLVKGAVIGFMSAAISFVFGQEIAKATSVATTKALMSPGPAETTTISAGPPVTVTTAPAGACPLDGKTEAHVHGDGTHWP